MCVLCVVTRVWGVLPDVCGQGEVAEITARAVDVFAGECPAKVRHKRMHVLSRVAHARTGSHASFLVAILQIAVVHRCSRGSHVLATLQVSRDSDVRYEVELLR